MNTSVLTDKINLIYGGIVAVLSYFLGEHWLLFVAFLGLNIIDYVTGCIKARINNKINSNKGLEGVMKKLGYWLMILLGYGMSAIFMDIGNSIGIDLQVTTFIGLLTLTALILNEIRSILENFIEAGYDVPDILVKGLEVANKAFDGKVPKDDN